jgi:hypothetical protein
MNSKDKMNAVFSGVNLSHFPVVVPYPDLLHRDQWEKITKQPYWTYFEWLKMEPKEHCKEYERFMEMLPFDWITPCWASSREDRENMEIIESEDGHLPGKRKGHSKRDTKGSPSLNTASAGRAAGLHQGRY